VAKLFQLQFLQFFSNKGPPAERQLRVGGTGGGLEASLLLGSRIGFKGLSLLAVDVILRWHLSVQLLYNVVLLQFQRVLCIFCDGCR